MKPKVLLVCYSFPPNPGVGGRKWAKLAGYLMKLGWEVHVMLRQPSAGDQSPWTSDTDGCIRHYIKPDYPQILEKSPAGTADKIRYRLALLRLKIKTNTNYYDRTVLMEQSFRQQLREIMKREDISRLVVTGAPFSLLWYAALEKQNHRGWTYVADIRDSWLGDEFYGFGLIGTKRREREKQRLTGVLNTADAVLVPYEKLFDEYQALSGGRANIQMLHHGTDDRYIQPRKPTEGSCRLIHFGSHYHDLDAVFRQMAAALAKTSGLDITFHTTDYKYRHFFENAGVFGKTCYYMPLVDEKTVFSLLSQHSAALLFTPAYMKDYISTKYLENAAARIPMLIIGQEGKASEFVTANRLGIFIREEDVADQLPQAAEMLARFNYNNDFDISPYLFSRQAERVAGLLNA